MRLWPSSLFGRLALLLVGVLALAIATTIFLFRQDRAALLLRQFGETKIVQLESIREALEALPADRPDDLERLARRHAVRIMPADVRDPAGFTSRGWRASGGGRRAAGDAPRSDRESRSRAGDSTDTGVRDTDSATDERDARLAALIDALTQLESRFTEALGAGVELRVQPRSRTLWVRLPVAATAYWVGFPLPARPGESEPSRALIISGALALALIVVAFLFARYLAAPLRGLEAAVARVGRGETVQPLPESGPSEIAAVNRGFNAMLANLRQIERDRAVLLAGISHDLRTPLARLRLGVELSSTDASLRQGMVGDIEEMDRVIGQFLDFARGDDAATVSTSDLDALAKSVADRYASNGRDVRFVAGGIPPFAMRATAITRLLTNLVDNALAYGAPPVEIRTSTARDTAVVEVMDRGPGIAVDDVERLKQPFTRATDSRARDDRAPGAGLGLAIVDRIARLHGGRFDLVPRDGGGTIARISLPTVASS